MIPSRAGLALAALLFLVPPALGGPTPAAAESPAGGGAAVPPGDDRLTPEQIAASVQASMDPDVDPCQDFYRFACGGWLDAVKLPADQSRWARSFSEITERNRTVLKELLDQAAKMAADAPEFALIGNYYGSCMDEAAIEEAGPRPVRPMLKQIAGITDMESLLRVVARMHRLGIPALWNPAVLPDFKKPDVNILQIFQGGLGLPDRDYYLADDKNEQRQGYEAHIARMLELLGTQADPAKKDAAAVVAFETELAKASMAREDRRDPQKIYNKLDMAGLKKLAPKILWDVYLKELGAEGVIDLNVGMPAFVERVQELIGATEPAALKTYLRWHLVNDAAPFLSSDFVDADFAFFGKKLAGRQELEARWKRCVRDTDGSVGEALAQAYIDRQFTGDSKDKAVAMIVGIERAFADNLADLAWMDDETRARAAEKMHAIANKIGFPDEWRDYSGLKIWPDRYLVNVMSAREFEFRRQIDKIGRPVDRKEWFMTPPTVNAYYNPLNNEMVFPAGILQAPFFHRDFPPMMNFGGIGMVMGHELTHGFDDSGRKFDGTGQMREWWNPSVSTKFDERAQCVDDLYDSFEVQPDLHLNGKLTLGENIADLGGVKQAFGAWRRWAEEHEGTPSGVDWLTPDQLFFVSYAQTWCSVTAPEFEQMLVTVDSHSPGRFRVNGPLANFPKFGEAFQCEVGTPMRPEKICEVW